LSIGFPSLLILQAVPQRVKELLSFTIFYFVQSLSIDAVDFNVRGEIWVNFKLIDEILALREFAMGAAELAEKALQDVDTFYLGCLLKVLQTD
jgi:hypothetical protein